MISLRLRDDEERLIRDYAKFHGLSVSEFLRQSAIERIEEEYDMKVMLEALAEFEQDPVTYSHEQAWAMIEDE